VVACEVDAEAHAITTGRVRDALETACATC